MFMTQRCGDTLLFRTPPVIAAQAAVGGKKEGEGPLAAAFDELSSDNRFGQSSWEAAEKYLQPAGLPPPFCRPPPPAQRSRAACGPAVCRRIVGS